MLCITNIIHHKYETTNTRNIIYTCKQSRYDGVAIASSYMVNLMCLRTHQSIHGELEEIAKESGAHARQHARELPIILCYLSMYDIFACNGM